MIKHLEESRALPSLVRFAHEGTKDGVISKALDLIEGFAIIRVFATLACRDQDPPIGQVELGYG